MNMAKQLPSRQDGIPRGRSEQPSRLSLSPSEVRPLSSSDFLSLMDEPNNFKNKYQSHYWVLPASSSSSPTKKKKKSRQRMIHEKEEFAMIDNSNIVYWSIPLPCGFLIKVRPNVLWECPGVLHDLQQDLQQCLQLLPKSVHALVKQFTIWVNGTFVYGPVCKPKVVKHSTAHHHEGWLIWAHDHPEKAPGVEIYNCWEYRKMRWHWNGCGLLLHELCHLIHQFCLGLEHTGVHHGWDRCCHNPQYQNVLRRDWAGLPTGDTDMAYGLINAKEWFAELSVAYLSTGYPEYDCCSVAENNNNNNNNAPADNPYTCMQKTSPPILTPDVAAKLQQQQQRGGTTTLSRKKMPRRSYPMPPCNKFFPFTRGQLKIFDPVTYALMEELWKKIAAWKDEDDLVVKQIRYSRIRLRQRHALQKRCFPF